MINFTTTEGDFSLNGLYIKPDLYRGRFNRSDIELAKEDIFREIFGNEWLETPDKGVWMIGTDKHQFTCKRSLGTLEIRWYQFDFFGDFRECLIYDTLESNDIVRYFTFFGPDKQSSPSELILKKLIQHRYWDEILKANNY